MARPKVKITITLEADVLDRVRVAVADGRSKSVSAYIEHAVIGQLAAEADFDSTIVEMLAKTGGPPTKEERAIARRLLTDPAA
jgi:Arc/MetJ-type ribon-helix-helix transcriptional regulator